MFGLFDAFCSVAETMKCVWLITDSESLVKSFVSAYQSRIDLKWYLRYKDILLNANSTLHFESSVYKYQPFNFDVTCVK